MKEYIKKYMMGQSINHFAYERKKYSAKMGIWGTVHTMAMYFDYPAWICNDPVLTSFRSNNVDPYCHGTPMTGQPS